MKIKRFCIPQSVIYKVIESEALVLNSKTGKFYRLNGSGTHLWLALKGKIDSPGLVSCLTDNFDVKRATAEKDVNGFLSGLKKRKLIEYS